MRPLHVSVIITVNHSQDFGHHQEYQLFVVQSAVSNAMKSHVMVLCYTYNIVIEKLYSNVIIGINHEFND